jgi:hypothetical protein
MAAAYTHKSPRQTETVGADYDMWEATGLTTTASYADVAFTDKDGNAYTNNMLPMHGRSLLEVTVDPGTTETCYVLILKRTTDSADEVSLLAEYTLTADTPECVYTSTCYAAGIVVQLKQLSGAVTDAAVYVMAK